MAFTPSTQYNLDAEDYHNCDSCDLINGRGIPLISLVALSNGLRNAGPAQEADENANARFARGLCDLRYFGG
jgi:hypothetical protein